MANIKSTKRAIISSVLALAISFTMLLGTTYAWFTDSVTSSNNIITAGNLDVELYWSTDANNWEEVNSDTEIFKENDLWEPGKTQVVYLKVKNAGTLALKYQLGVNIVDEKGSMNKFGKAFMLSDYIKYGIADGALAFNDRAEAIAAVSENATAIKNDYSSESIRLVANDEKIVTMVVYMPESVGDEANYRGIAPEITLGINVFARQFGYEFDSFDDDYDYNSIYYDVRVTTEEELIEALNNASKDIVIAINGKITLTKALSKSGMDSVKLVGWNDEALIDQDKYNMHFAGANVIFEGLTLTHGEKAYGNGGQTSTAFAVWDAEKVSYIDCTFNRSVGTIHASVHNFVGCTFNGVENPDNSKSEYPLYICDGEEYNVIGCTFNCTNRGAILFYNDSGSGVDTLNISNTRFYGDIIADKTAVEIHNNSVTQVYNVNIKDVVVGTGVINGLYRIKPANVGEVNVKVDGVTKAVPATDKKSLENAIKSVDDGDTVYLVNDIALPRNFEIARPIMIDLNRNTITGDDPWQIMLLKKGVSIRNGNITVNTNVAAIKAYDMGTIEDIVLSVTPKDPNKVVTAIAVQSGYNVDLIKDVTIKGFTQGIEIIGGGSRIERIENVKIAEDSNGDKPGVALQLVNGTIGDIVDCTFRGENYGMQIIATGGYDVSAKLTNSFVEGGEAPVYMHNNNSANNKSVTFEYDADSIVRGDIKQGFSSSFSGTVTINKKEN